MQEDLILLIQKQGNYLNGLSHFFRELNYETYLQELINYKFIDPTKLQLNYIYENNKTYSSDLIILINSITPLHLFSYDKIVTAYNLFYIDPKDNQMYCIFDGQGFIKISFIEFIKRLINETK